MTHDPKSSEAAYSSMPVPPNLQPWDSGFSVVELQALLNAHGYQLRLDGDFGCQTEAAVRAFQRQHHLRPNGIVDEKTWRALQTTVQAGARKLRRGYMGADVREMQGLLQIHGYAIQRDGIFDYETEDAVLSFQRRHQLIPDGLVGPRTWTMLRGSPLPSVPQQRGWYYNLKRWW